MDELALSAESSTKELESMKNRAHSLGSPFQRCEYCNETLLYYGRVHQNHHTHGTTGGAGVQQQQQFYLFPCSHGFHAPCLLKRAPQHLDPAQLEAVRGIEEMLRGLGGRVKDKDNRARAQLEALQAEV